MLTSEPTTLRPLRILLINPNTTVSITESLRPVAERVLAAHLNVSCDFFTAPTGIASIDGPADAEASAAHCWPALRALVPAYDAFLVSCYSQHPLVSMLCAEIAQIAARERNEGTERRQRRVTGILEASVGVSLGLLGAGQAFGIVSTGKVWEDELARAVFAFLGVPATERFAGCETTGLSAKMLHEMPAAEVRTRMAEAAARLVRKRDGVSVICLGCAGMVGLEDAVREGVVSAFGAEAGEEVTVVDGVIAGIDWLVGACRAAF